MAGSIWDWSTTAANNDVADASINWQENQLPDTVNNSARQMMGRTAELLDDLGGLATVGGSANAITLTAKSAFAALADGLIVGFKATSSNTGATTINANSLGVKSIRKFTGAGESDVDAGDIQSGGIYKLIYSSAANSAAGAWLMANAPARQTFPTVQVFSASGTWTKPSGCRRIIIEAVGGGGGGGGINGTVNTGRGSGGGGGGFHGHTIPLDVTSVSSFSVTIGAGGTAGTGSGNVPGGSGGNTSCTVNGTTYTWGGGGGAPSPNSSPGAALTRGGVGGTGINVIGGGQQGIYGASWWDTAASGGNAEGGAGGSSPFGTGGMGGSVVTAVADTAVASPVGYGAGGQGRGMINQTATINGAAGTGGYMWIWEFY